MASKYAKLKGKLPDAPIDDISRQEKIDAIKDAIRSEETHTPESLARAYHMARFGRQPGLFSTMERQAFISALGVEGIDELLSEAQRILEAHEQLLIESYETDERGWGEYGASESTVRLPSGSSVSAQWEPYPKVEDKERFRQWCVKNGLEQSLQLWPSTMASITKQYLMAGQPEPDGVVAYGRYKIVYRKAGARAADE